MRSDLNIRYGEERLPRYTSYPTAPHFSCSISQQTYRQWLASVSQEQTVSLYLHIPFCRSMCWYCGCNTTIARRNEPIAEYLAEMRREIDMVASHVVRPLRINHIHFGGGTPTIVTPSQFAELMNILRQKFTLRSDAEVAVEVDPRTLTREMILELGASGVTRASLGVQSFDPAVQQAINRIQSFKDTATATEQLRAAGVRGINFDLIYGLPRQTVASCFDTARKCLWLRPDRLSVFGYAHVPTFKKHQRKIDEAALPDGANRHLQANMIAYSLTAAGYRQIGRGDLATEKGYALTADDRLRADIIERIMCDFRVDLQQVCARHGTTPAATLQSATRLHGLTADGVVNLDGAVLSVRDDARHLVRSVASAFDAYIGTSGPVYSRAV